jgi:hypothetical protein
LSKRDYEPLSAEKRLNITEGMAEKTLLEARSAFVENQEMRDIVQRLLRRQKRQAKFTLEFVRGRGLIKA